MWSHDRRHLSEARGGQGCYRSQTRVLRVHRGAWLQVETLGSTFFICDTSLGMELLDTSLPQTSSLHNWCLMFETLRIKLKLSSIKSIKVWMENWKLTVENIMLGLLLKILFMFPNRPLLEMYSKSDWFHAAMLSKVCQDSRNKWLELSSQKQLTLIASILEKISILVQVAFCQSEMIWLLQGKWVN